MVACVGLGESLRLPGSAAYRKAERRGLDRFDIGIGIALPLELGAIAPDHRHRHNGHIGKKV